MAHRIQRYMKGYLVHSKLQQRLCMLKIEKLQNEVGELQRMQQKDAVRVISYAVKRYLEGKKR